MNRCLLISLTAFCISLFTFAEITGRESLWVSSSNAKLKAKRAASSQTIENLPIGTELSVLSYKKRWYQVKTSSGKKGWIYRGKVTKTTKPFQL